MQKNVMPLVHHDGLQAYVFAYANAPSWQGVVYLSLVGYRASVRAIWAALVGGQLVDLNGDQWLRRIAEMPYRTHAVALPENGLTHFTMLSVQATRFLERAQPFYVLREERDDTARLLQRFVGLFDLAVGVPVLPHWAAELWRAGLSQEYRLIESCAQAAGIAAWKADADADAWLALIQAGVQDGRFA